MHYAFPQVNGFSVGVHHDPPRCPPTVPQHLFRVGWHPVQGARLPGPPRIFSPVLILLGPPVDIAWTGVDRRRQDRVWDLRPPLFPSAPSFGWTDAPASANGKFLVRHASRPPSGRQPLLPVRHVEECLCVEVVHWGPSQEIVSLHFRDFRVFRVQEE